MEWKEFSIADRNRQRKSSQKHYTVIAGCGRLGANIAGKLSDQNRDVLILDLDKTSLRKLPPSYGGLTMVAGATDMEKLEAARLREAAAFIAVTDNDNVNLCAAQIAKKLFHVPRVVVRIYDEEKAMLLKPLGIDVICPAQLSEKEISHYINYEGNQDIRRETEQ